MVAIRKQRPEYSAVLEPGDDVLVMFGMARKKFFKGVYLGPGLKRDECAVWLGTKLGVHHATLRRVVYYPDRETIALRAAVIRESRRDPELRALLGLPRVAALEGEGGDDED